MEGYLLYLLLVGVITVCLVLWKGSSSFRYHVKFIYFFGMVLLTALAVTPLVALRPRNCENIGPVAVWWSYVFSILGIKVEPRGFRHLQTNKPVVIVSNHQSSIDLYALMSFFPHRCSVLVKKELLYAGTFGFAAWLSGLIFVDRLNREKALSTMEKLANKLITENIKIWIFPEGTRNLDGSFLPFKKGAFNLAIQAQVPVVPVIYSSYRPYLSFKKKIFESGKCIFTCLPPIPTTGLGPDDATELTERVRKQMLATFMETSQEVLEEAQQAGKSLI